MKDPRLFEIANGAAAILGVIFAALLLTYLIRESRRRHMDIHDWLLKLPVNMHFAIAVLIFDIFVSYRESVIWFWYRFHGGQELPEGIRDALVFGSIGMIMGALCKVRALSKPDYGDAPWLASAAVVWAFVLGTLLSR